MSRQAAPANVSTNLMGRTVEALCPSVRLLRSADSVKLLLLYLKCFVNRLRR
jgi:hypothetical protein